MCSPSGCGSPAPCGAAPCPSPSKGKKCCGNGGGNGGNSGCGDEGDGHIQVTLDGKVCCGPKYYLLNKGRNNGECGGGGGCGSPPVKKAPVRPPPNYSNKYEPGICKRPCCKHWKPRDENGKLIEPCKYDDPCKAHCFNHPPGIKPSGRYPPPYYTGPLRRR